MARFRYSLQSILNIKLKMETLAKQEFAAAKNALDREEERLQKLKARKTYYEEQAGSLLSAALFAAVSIPFFPFQVFAFLWEHSASPH